MRKELIIAILVSATIHVGFLFGERLFPNKPPPPKVHHEEDEVLAIELPPLPPEEPDTVEDMVDDQPQNQIAPPSLVDLPTVVPVDAIVQQIQPPPPPDLEVSKGAVTIPVTKPGTNFGKGMKDLFDISQLDQRPVPRLQMKPNYPYDMQRERIEGECLVAFICTSSGDVIEAYAVSATRREFERPAIDAVMRWKFKPGKKGGRAVNTKMMVPIKFTLDD
jgi:protein TonB